MTILHIKYIKQSNWPWHLAQKPPLMAGSFWWSRLFWRLVAILRKTSMKRMLPVWEDHFRVEGFHGSWGVLFFSSLFATICRSLHHQDRDICPKYAIHFLTNMSRYKNNILLLLCLYIYIVYLSLHPSIWIYLVYMINPRWSKKWPYHFSMFSCNLLHKQLIKTPVGCFILEIILPSYVLGDYNHGRYRDPSLLMAEILHQPVEVGSLSHFLRGFIHPWWLFGYIYQPQWFPDFSRGGDPSCHLGLHRTYVRGSDISNVV